MTDYDTIPDELQDRDQWLTWNGATDKPRAPLSRPTDDYPASWSDPDEWLSFDTAVQRADGVDTAGIGFVNARDNDDYPRGIVGSIDIDGCIKDGSPKDWVPSLAPFFERDAYIERSPSDEGLRIPIIGLDVPDWWSDEHFSDDEHEGVEVLTNKFSTYTGDRLRSAGAEPAEYGDWVDEWLREVYRVLYGEDPLVDEDGDDQRLEGDAPDSEFDGDEWLTEDVADDALDAISPDASYSTWRDVGMALANHFGTTDGERLFTQWSKRGSKWDSDAERQAERIVSDASDYNYGPSTLVYHAQNHGWDAGKAMREHGVARSDGGATTKSGGAANPERPGGAGADPDRDWSLAPTDVLELAVRDNQHPMDYEGEAYSGFVRDLRTPERATYVWQLAQKCNQDNILAQHKGPVYTYEGGVWSDDDNERLRQLAGGALGSAYSKSVVSELESQVRRDRQKRYDELGAPDEKLMCDNGLLDLRERVTVDAKPDHYALSKIPTEHDPDAECPRWLDFIDESIDSEEDLRKFQEYAGYALWRHSQQFGKALFLVGPTDSGKGTALKAIKQVLGRENVASESLQDLIQTRWGAAQLFGKIANIRNEVSPSGLSEVQKFKEYTGGEDEVSAEFKGKDKFQMVVTQKFLFATNEVPSVKKAGEAFYNRLLFVQFPNTVPPEEQDKELLDKFADERSGILNWMLDGLDRLLENGQFSGERTTAGKKEICDAFGGVLDRFTHNCLMVTGDEDDIVAKSDIHDLAHAYADDIDKEPEWGKQSGFTQEIKNERGISDGQRRIDGDNPKVLTGVRVKPEVVYRYDMDIRARTSGTDDPDAVGLHNYQDSDIRPGYDSSEERNLPPLIVKTVRDQNGRQGMAHDELVSELQVTGERIEDIEHAIDKCLERGDIYQPETDVYRAD